MKLHRTTAAVFLELDGAFFRLADEWDALTRRDDLPSYLRSHVLGGIPESSLEGRILPPIGRQEVWAAGVTYYRSRVARLEESQEAGGGSFYDRVYEAERPELFFKATGWRVRGPGDAVRIRHDASWSVPEPEIALCLSPSGAIVGYTIGNDMSSRDIEGENPLYLPQAKIYDGSCSLGPALLVADEPLSPDTAIELRIVRAGTCVFEGQTTFSRMRREPRVLIDFLYRETSFPDGCVLLTGTGVVPGDDVRLAGGDEIHITVPPIGTLTNVVETTRQT